MTFLEFVKTRRVTDTIRGDLIADMARDSMLPDAASWHALEAYLRTKRADPDVLIVARALFRQFLRKRALDYRRLKE